MGQKVTAVDLFAGAGGLSCGLEAAGASVVLAVEAHAETARTYAANHPGTAILTETIDEEWDVVAKLRHHVGEKTCHILAGGPPCQGWSTLGPRANPERRDRFNACVDYFVRQVELLRPAAVVFENVQGFAHREGGKNLAALETHLVGLGYTVESALLRSADYGVPQLRRRLFVVAVQAAVGVEYRFPPPAVDEEDWETTWDAIGDLPSLAPSEKSNNYRCAPQTPLQRRLRGSATRLTLHEAPNHSEKIREVLRGLRGEGASRSQLEGEVKLTSGFHNTYCRLRSDTPAPAVTSSSGRVSSGRNAHPFDDRALTPREAARLQTFPDSYQWVGHRWPLYVQIGNGVPPVLAQAVTRPLVLLLERVMSSAHAA